MHPPDKARRGSIPTVFDRGATQSDEMRRRPNAKLSCDHCTRIVTRGRSTPGRRTGRAYMKTGDSVSLSPGVKMAGPTRFELATSGVTGRRSNQLNYDPAS